MLAPVNWLIKSNAQHEIYWHMTVHRPTVCVALQTSSIHLAGNDSSFEAELKPLHHYSKGQLLASVTRS